MNSEQLKKKWQDPVYRANQIKAQTGKKLSEEHKDKLRKHLKVINKDNPFGFKKGVHVSSATEFKKGFTPHNKGKIGYTNKGTFKSGPNHPGWIDGLSRNGYSSEFNKELKLKIRTRDNFTCCRCGKTEREELEELNRVLCVNHIDFKKDNYSEKNLNTLCLKCNVQINRDRDYWTNYFNNL